MYQTRLLTVLFIKVFFKILRNLGLRGSLLEVHIYLVYFNHLVQET